MAEQTIAKVLSANDTGETGGHQGNAATRIGDQVGRQPNSTQSCRGGRAAGRDPRARRTQFCSPEPIRDQHIHRRDRTDYQPVQARSDGRPLASV